MTWNYRIVKMCAFPILIKEIECFLRELKEYNIKDPVSKLKGLIKEYEEEIKDDKKEPLIFYNVHEVFYNKRGESWGRTIEPINFGTDLVDSDEEAKEEIIDSLSRALNDAKKHSIFEDPEKWADALEEEDEETSDM